MARILIADDEVGIRALLTRVLKADQHTIQAAEDGLSALAVAQEFEPDVALLDIKMPGMDGVEVLRNIKEKKPDTVVIMLTAHATVETAVEAMKIGAFDYIRKPFDVQHVKLAVQRGLEVADLKQSVVQLRKQVKQRFSLGNIIGKDKRMQEIYDLIETVAPSKSTVLITGESGTGKELIARAIHYHSARADKPFVAVNCAAISEELLESELFGHIKGSFTGATSDKVGKFELADGGTLFLDEVSEMAPKLQAKLLRVLQESEIDKVGGGHPITVDVRVLGSTNRDLREEIKGGHFREDLFYRLNVVSIEFPPLRERRGDIPLLVEHFLAQQNEINNKNITGVSDEALQLLMNYHWPGNVRELENVVERAVVLCQGQQIEPAHLSADIREPVPQSGPAIEVGMTVADAERILIQETLKAFQWNRTKAVDVLGISIRTLRNKLKEYQEKGLMEIEG